MQDNNAYQIRQFSILLLRNKDVIFFIRSYCSYLTLIIFHNQNILIEYFQNACNIVIYFIVYYAFKVFRNSNQLLPRYP